MKVSDDSTRVTVNNRCMIDLYNFESSTDRPATGEDQPAIKRYQSMKGRFLIIPKRQAKMEVELEMRQPLNFPLASEKASPTKHPGFNTVDKFIDSSMKEKEYGFSKYAAMQINARVAKSQSTIEDLKSIHLSKMEGSPINKVQLDEYTSRSNAAPSMKMIARRDSGIGEDMKEIEKRNQSLRELAAQIFKAYQPKVDVSKQTKEANKRQNKSIFTKQGSLPTIFNPSHLPTIPAHESLDRSRSPDWMMTPSGLSFGKSKSYVRGLLKDVLRNERRRKSDAQSRRPAINLQVKHTDFMLKRRSTVVRQAPNV